MDATPNEIRSSDGTTIAWYDFGGNGPDMLLAHATGFCARMWQPFVTHLTGHFRCVAYDTRGHGESSRPSDRAHGFDWQRFADDAKAVIDAARLLDPYGVGHSSGGATEMLLEQRSPGTFKSLYLFEPVIFANDPPLGPMPDRELARRTRKRRTMFTSRDEALSNFTEKGPFVDLDPAAMAAYLDHGFEHLPDDSLLLRCSPEDEAEIYVMASAHTGYVELASVRCPVVVACGGRSHSFTEAEMTAVVDRLSDARLEPFADLGHFGPLEQPERVAEAVLSSFRGL